jgi:sugar phosphate permease
MKTETGTLVRWRGQVFLAGWTLYAGYYICRKDVVSATDSAVSQFAITLACFAVTYAIGQIIGGVLADRFGARRTALAGAAISITCTGLMAWCARPDHALVLQFGNGLGQGFGWPSLLKLIGSWFRRGERDRVLGWWSTSYILGGLLATSLTAWLVLHVGVVSRSGFYPAYLVSSGVLLSTALFFFRATAGLPDQIPLDIAPSSSPSARLSFWGAWRMIVGNRTIRIISGMYFFLKMTRYTLLFWLPHYLISSLGYSVRTAERSASYFELLGFLGPIAAGYAVERWFGSRRMALGTGMLFALAFLCLLHPMLALSGWFAMTVSISLIGILIYGADVLMSGMAVLEAVPEELHGRAIGFVNGIGSMGQMLSPFLVTVFVSHLGWTRLFDLFVFFALVAGVIGAIGARQPQQTLKSKRSMLEPSEQPL